ncbi:hypothetical protein ACOSQ3_021670 [Xanthoceras sorbifolium]
MREASSLKTLNGRVRGSLSLWRLSARKCQRTSCKGQGILVWSREIRWGMGWCMGHGTYYWRERGNTYFVFGATPECFVAVVGESGTVGKVDVVGGRRWKRRARARGEQDVGMRHEDIGGKRMGDLVCVDSDHGPKRRFLTVAFGEIMVLFCAVCLSHSPGCEGPS